MSSIQFFMSSVHCARMGHYPAASAYPGIRFSPNRRRRWYPWRWFRDLHAVEGKDSGSVYLHTAALHKQEGMTCFPYSKKETHKDQDNSGSLGQVPSRRNFFPRWHFPEWNILVDITQMCQWHLPYWQYFFYCKNAPHGVPPPTMPLVKDHPLLAPRG